MTAWSETELDAIRRGVEGELPLPEMFDLLPRRKPREIRIKFQLHGFPDEDERRVRGARVGCCAMERAIAATGKRYT